MADPDLVSAGLRAFRNIAATWQLTEAEQAALLGRGEDGGGADDLLLRLSYVLGIFKAINTLLPDPVRADEWLRKPNAAPLFNGRSAIDFMSSGGADDLAAVRAYLDAELYR